MSLINIYDIKLTINIGSEWEEQIYLGFVRILTLRGILLTSVTQNTAYAKSQTQQVYAKTFPIDILAELTVNSRQKPEWLWQARDIGFPPMSVNASSSILNADKTKQNQFLAIAVDGLASFLRMRHFVGLRKCPYNVIFPIVFN